MTDNNTTNTSENKKAKSDRPQNKNLISLADRTVEERREIGRKGGLKSGETKRNRKTMRDTIIEMLAETITDDMIKEYGLEKVMNKQGTKTYMDAVMSACLLNAINGDSKSIQILRDTMGEMPTVKTENRTEIITKEDIQTMDNLRKYLTG
jgi:hypothetical protein